MDIILKENNTGFHFRVRGIIKQKNKYLLMRVDDAEYYHIPGGHVEIGETSEQAIIREIKEEIGIDITINKLICVSERFYEKKSVNFHELVFYFIVTPTDSINIESTTRIENDKGKVFSNELIWVTAEDMKNLEIKPQMIKDIIINNSLDTFRHKVN